MKSATTTSGFFKTNHSNLKLEDSKKKRTTSKKVRLPQYDTCGNCSGEKKSASKKKSVNKIKKST